MKIKVYDRVILKDRRTATIIEVLDDGLAYLVDVDLPGPDWETVQIRHEEIKEKIG